jgi:hypothetical protein
MVLKSSLVLKIRIPGAEPHHGSEPGTMLNFVTVLDFNIELNLSLKYRMLMFSLNLCHV